MRKSWEKIHESRVLYSPNFVRNDSWETGCTERVLVGRLRAVLEALRDLSGHKLNSCQGEKFSDNWFRVVLAGFCSELAPMVFVLDERSETTPTTFPGPFKLSLAI